MADEIERRFLVEAGFDPCSVARDSSMIVQSYLRGTGDWIVRVRREEGLQGVQHYIALKRPKTAMTNKEHDVPVSLESYQDLRESCGVEVVKTRHFIPWRGRVWEVDVYADPRISPGMIAEVEIPAEDAGVDLPPWIGREVTGDRWYSNYQIALRLEEAQGEDN